MSDLPSGMYLLSMLIFYRYHLDANTIIRDLTAEKPQWILSCYGPGKNAPEQIFGGNREQSFEEMRYKYYLAVHQGTAPEAVNEAIALWESAEAQNNVVLGDVHGAIRSVIARGEQRPNRIDYVSAHSIYRRPIPDWRGENKTFWNVGGVIN